MHRRIRQFETRRLSLRCDRRGITLFEVVLALAIFLGATAVIGQVLQNGSRAATKAQLTSEAILRCERRLNEVLAGVLPLSSVQKTPFEDDPAWQWSVNLAETEIPYLVDVEVVVAHLSSRGLENVSVRLNRLLRDPQIYADAATLDEEQL